MIGSSLLANDEPDSKGGRFRRDVAVEMRTVQMDFSYSLSDLGGLLLGE